VRVRAGALGPAMPSRDLVLSPDHALFLDGELVPVRYLINGGTIVQEDAHSVTYFHVELERHDILIAEGAPAESYLDTGNRTAFANGGSTVMAHPDFARAIWRTGGFAPLLTGGRALHDLRTRLQGRAADCGFQLVADPAACLLADGRVIRPKRDGQRLRFTLRERARRISIVSRSAVGCHVIPVSDDRRRLGVAVVKLEVDGIVVPLGDRRLGQGWHEVEPDWRWTDGQAELLAEFAAQIDITVALMPVRYWIERQDSDVIDRRVA
jgi:hypothetical protein